eukprot:Protomagalhaensia_wolfi_Nauph_80__854@NODE_1494_length_1503_cov_7_485656_g1158_i0_p1_GENE_NODE_1494_length_1503_cov_7_485656_g1158_i0NODE_1494_length_1503_cov_7_485656_g1158_i0_p1_ORF_typecomplete_len429_score74_49Kelch_4/PF13418_6/4_9e08Kelch_4/PF13418_6/7_6e08Kelch_4/PF13418_6/2_1e06Kelch_4/PF13418_6/0_0074Kelch_4/PF13418_6/27Kelch_3/PF13415_6/3_1e11Kelch_3/PF13415_6/9_3e06Kelch_3/PF13415_6/0_00016Kelch_3/PF13415_6/0_08Kelch_3/PF13415_6/6_2e03Kelch_6/PF13964_6/2_6e06Kelch_6/PF13964_6/3_4e07Kel
MVADPQNRTLLLFGGRSSTSCFNDLWSYSMSDHSWTHLSGPIFDTATGAVQYPPSESPLPPPRHWHSANFYKGSMYVVGGWSHYGDVFGEVWRFDTTTLNWECLCAAAKNRGSISVASGEPDSQSATAAPPSPVSQQRPDTLGEMFALEGRSCHQSVIWRGALYVYGGVVNHNFVASDELWKFDLYSKEWFFVPTTGAGPGKRVSPASTLCGDAWILHGGLTSYPGAAAVPVSDVFHFDFVTSHWTRKTEISFVPPADPKTQDRYKIVRYGHSGVTAVGNCPIFFGGADAYASAQSNLSWRIEILPSVTQIGRVLERKVFEEEERRKLLRDIGRLQEESRVQTTRLAMQEKEISYWRSLIEDTAFTLEALTDKIQILERQVSQLTANAEEYEPLLDAARDFATVVLNVRDSTVKGRKQQPGSEGEKCD